jgi:hypothetical protein
LRRRIGFLALGAALALAGCAALQPSPNAQAASVGGVELGGAPSKVQTIAGVCDLYSETATNLATAVDHNLLSKEQRGTVRQAVSVIAPVCTDQKQLDSGESATAALRVALNTLTTTLLLAGGK